MVECFFLSISQVAKAGNYGGPDVPSPSEARGYSPVRPFETGHPSISPMLGSGDDTTPSSRRESFPPLGGQDPF